MFLNFFYCSNTVVSISPPPLYPNPAIPNKQTTNKTKHSSEIQRVLNLDGTWGITSSSLYWLENWVPERENYTVY